MKTTLTCSTALAFLTLLLAGCRRQENATVETRPTQTANSAAGQPAAEPRLMVRVDREKASALGVRVSEAASVVAEAYGDNPIPKDADLATLSVRSSNGELVPLSSIAQITLAHATDQVEKSDADFLQESKDAPPAAQPDDQAAYEAWFKKYHLDLSDPAMLKADADGDGVSNRDEFLADTNPRNASSHPPLAAAQPPLRFTEYHEGKLPLVLEAVRGGKAVIKNGDLRETVVVGDRMRGLPLRVTKITDRKTSDKEGEPTDRSQVLLEDTATKATVTLVKDLPAKTTATHAVLTSADGQTSLQVRAGEVFSLPGDPATTYRVLDIAPDEVLVQQPDTRKTWTLLRQ